MKKIMALTLVGVLMVGTTALSFADTFSSPSNILSGLTDFTAEEVYEQKADDETFGDLAKELGVYEAFKADFLTGKLSALQTKVASGDITQADYELLVIELENCDGTSSKLLKDLGMQFGRTENGGRGQNKGATSEGKYLNRNVDGNSGAGNQDGNGNKNR